MPDQIWDIEDTLRYRRKIVEAMSTQRRITEENQKKQMLEQKPAGALTVAELKELLAKKTQLDRPAALARVAAIQDEMKALYKELGSLAETYELQVQIDISTSLYERLDRTPGWDSSSARC